MFFCCFFGVLFYFFMIHRKAIKTVLSNSIYPCTQETPWCTRMTIMFCYLHWSFTIQTKVKQKLSHHLLISPSASGVLVFHPEGIVEFLYQILNDNGISSYLIIYVQTAHEKLQRSKTSGNVLADKLVEYSGIVCKEGDNGWWYCKWKTNALSQSKPNSCIFWILHFFST